MLEDTSFRGPVLDTSAPACPCPVCRSLPAVPEVPVRRPPSGRGGATSPPTALLASGMLAAAALVARPAEDGDDLTAELLAAMVPVIPAATSASLVEHRPGRPPRTVATVDTLGAVTDLVQFTAEQGPVLDAARLRTVAVQDLLDDPRWPELSAHGRCGATARSVLSVQLRALTHQPVLSLYSPVPHAFTRGDTLLWETTAAASQSALAGLAQRERTHHLHRALMTNRRIGLAVGVLMSRHRWTETEAFTSMSALSQQCNRKLVDIADEVALIGDLPDPAGTGPA